MRRKSKGVRERGLKTLWKWATKNGFLFLDIYYAAWKIVKYHEYASVIYLIVLKFDLIKVHLRSFRLFSLHL